VHFDIGVLYIRNVRYLGPRRLKVNVGNVLLEGLYHLDGRLRPRCLSSIYNSVKGLVRAGHTLLWEGTSDGALLYARWSRERNGGGGRRRHRGDVCDVGVLLGMIGLLGLAFASVLAALALMAILTLLLLVIALLLVRPILLALPVRVTTLALHYADLVGVVLARAMVNRVHLELRNNCSAHIAKLKILKVIVASDDRDEHLPFLRECGQGDHRLELRGDCNTCSLYVAVGCKGLVKVGVEVSIKRNATIEAVFEVFEDGGSCQLSIRPL
jgi:hypothetical protein